MNTTEFHQIAEQLMSTIEEQLDNHEGDADIDCETQGGVMTLSFEDKSKIIINRQEPLHQIWLATRNGGYHFNYHKSQWVCDKTDGEFLSILAQAISMQSGKTFSFA